MEKGSRGVRVIWGFFIHTHKYPGDFRNHCHSKALSITPVIRVKNTLRMTGPDYSSKTYFTLKDNIIDVHSNSI